MPVINRLLGTALAAGALLLAAVTPAAAQPATVTPPPVATYYAYGLSAFEAVAIEGATAGADQQANAAGFATSQCQQIGEWAAPSMIPGQPIHWNARVELLCKTPPPPGTVDLVRFLGTDHMSTTGNPPAGYSSEGSLGYLDTSQAPGTMPLFMCTEQGHTFTSSDTHCEGQGFVQQLGYVYWAPPAGISVKVLMRCWYSGGLFDSNDPNCEGQNISGRLGYILA
ncbi:hypothetical protein P3T37_005015 [Kitasatospora sp. MAA4]|uniref:hypothetical protein n=1 Tax=Kitasatospora sp. MAA4 TaxID=3035093 RepID=UPI00247491A4|nr:hypothetical protein [Kitasatospora sp. MAA4]MDH6135599.1 hypothetical protein [Kitasatospora sp. MAA4]